MPESRVQQALRDIEKRALTSLPPAHDRTERAQTFAALSVNVLAGACSSAGGESVK